MIQAGIGAGVGDKKYILAGLYHSYSSPWIILGCFCPGRLCLTVLNKNWSEIVGILYSRFQKYISQKPHLRSINGAVIFHSHYTVAGMIVSVDHTIFDAHTKR